MHVANLYIVPSMEAMMHELELVEKLARVAGEGGCDPLQGRGAIA